MPRTRSISSRIPQTGRREGDRGVSVRRAGADATGRRGGERRMWERGDLDEIARSVVACQRCRSTSKRTDHNVLSDSVADYLAQSSVGSIRSRYTIVGSVFQSADVGITSAVTHIESTRSRITTGATRSISTALNIKSSPLPWYADARSTRRRLHVVGLEVSAVRRWRGVVGCTVDLVGRRGETRGRALHVVGDEADLVESERDVEDRVHDADVDGRDEVRSSKRVDDRRLHLEVGEVSVVRCARDLEVRRFVLDRRNLCVVRRDIDSDVCRMRMEGRRG